MGIKQMYKGIANSPQTILTKTIGATDTVIEVAGIDVFPAGPNIAVIGIDEEAETITYATKTDTALSGCKRGVEGKAKAWETDSLISRNFTNYDYDTLIENILTLDKEKTASSDFTSFKDEIIKQLGNADTENGKKYATKQELSTAETNLDKKINTKLTTTTFEDYKNTNQTALDKKTNNTDFEVYKKEVTSNLAKKVDKVVGKGLSTNDYTTVEKNKLAGIQAGAQVNAVTSVQGKTGVVTITKSDVGLGNVDNIKQMPISGGILENYREKLVTVAASGGSIDLSLGNVFQHAPSGNRTYSITNAVNGQAHSFTLIINMGSTVRTLTFPSSVKWQGGEIPDMSETNKTYVLTFMSVNGGGNWYGMFGGEF